MSPDWTKRPKGRLMQLTKETKMNNVIVNFESCELNNSYQIVDDFDEYGSLIYSIWISTGPITGHYLKDLDNEECHFNTIVEAIKALVELVEEYEPQVA